MATPTFSISVPEHEQDIVKAALPDLLDFAGIDGTPASLSGLVRNLIMSSERLTTSSLNQFLAKETMKGGEKRYLVITIK